MRNIKRGVYIHHINNSVCSHNRRMISDEASHTLTSELKIESGNIFISTREGDEVLVRWLVIFECHKHSVFIIFWSHSSS